MKNVRLKMTVTFEYDADSKNYGTEIPEEMAKIDQDNYNEDPNILIEMMADYDYEVKVEPILKDPISSVQ